MIAGQDRPDGGGADSVLPSYAPLAERAGRELEALEAFAGQRGDDVLLWCWLGARMAHLRLNEPRAVPARLAAGKVRRMRRVHVSRGKRTTPHGFQVRLGDGCLFTAPRANQRRSQAALYERFGPVHTSKVEIRAPWWRTRRRADQAIRLAGELIDFARARELELALDGASLHRDLLRVARLLGAYEELLARERPRAVVVGTLWSLPERTLLHAAREAGIPSVYVPHCPHRCDARSIDMAVDYAALRGVGEVDFLAANGVARDRLDVVGDPTIAPGDRPPIDPAAPAVFAPNTERAAVLEPLIEVISQALGEQVVVGRHPNRAQSSSPFPPGWPIHPGRTLELLEGGAPVVLQSSSGVALEAMHLGIPVVELHFPDRPAVYPSIREPQVRFASCSSQVRAAVAASRADADNPARRQDIVDWARRWSWPAGQEAARRLVALVEKAIAEGLREPIRDSMRPTASTADRPSG